MFMKIGPYNIFPELPHVLWRNVIDAHRVRTQGIPRLPGDTPLEIATAVMIHNAQEVLCAGQGHFLFMWPSDFGKAIRGALRVLPASYLGNLIELMIIESARLGYVPTCFTPYPGFRGFDMPYKRADNLPWLFHAAYEHAKFTNDNTLIHTHKQKLQRLVLLWEETHLENDLIKRSVTGDWMDTILRPSSTYNNLCALHMLDRCSKLGLHTRTSVHTMAREIRASRLKEGYFVDYAGTVRRSIDASVIALYLELFDAPLRETLADELAQSSEVHPYPIRCTTSSYPKKIISPIVRLFPHYHDGIWIHLGMMYLNGMRMLGRDITQERHTIDELIMEYGNMIETLTEHGALYASLLHATEYGLTMTAGQYLELTA